MNASAERQLKKHKGKIVWIASYPKSGNTWMRAFLTALLYEGTPKINHLLSDFSLYNKSLFEDYISLDPSLLLPSEILEYEIRIVRSIVDNADSDRMLFSKVHHNVPSFVEPDSTHAVIYIVRNPLGIVPSLANHNQSSYERAINCMNDSNYQYSAQRKGLHNEILLPQRIGKWNTHVTNWLRINDVPVILMRYEDMLLKPKESFGSLIEQLDLEFSDEELVRAIQQSSFKMLRAQEEEVSFKEKNPKTKHFFRKGSWESWKEELTMKQKDQIIQRHKSVMRQLRYPIDLNAYELPTI